MLKVKYGVNPHQTATLTGHSPEIFEVQDQPISFNVIQDVLLASAIIQTGRPAVAYVKHKLPLAVGTGESITEALNQLCGILRRAGNIEFGTIVLNESIALDDLQALAHVRFHTIAAPDWPDAAIEHLYTQAMQTLNHGIAVIGFRSGLTIWEVSLRLTDDSLISYMDPAFALPLPGYKASHAVKNSAWSDPEGLSIALRTLAHARTIAVVVLIDGQIALVRNGYYDGIAALKQTLADAVSEGLNLSRATIACDGCFGIRSPLEVLSGAGVSQFVFSGGKANDEALVAEAEQHGIGSLCTKFRYFYL
jgi:AICAR transformylase/IMP cyclohydrolase PurH